MPRRRAALAFLAVLLALGAEHARAQVPEPLLAIDTLLTVENDGLSRLFVTLNEHAFKLVADPAEVGASANAFAVPRHGAVTINIADLLAPDDENPFDDDCSLPVPNGNNCIAFVPQGPDDARAQVVISDTPVQGRPVAYAITRSDLEPLPDALDLHPAYPNPFAGAATLTYTVPAARTAGVPVTLAVFDVLGRRVRVLVDGVRYPGTFAVAWDGRDDAGRPVAAGLYVARLATPEVAEAVRLTRLR